MELESQESYASSAGGNTLSVYVFIFEFWLDVADEESDDEIDVYDCFGDEDMDVQPELEQNDPEWYGALYQSVTCSLLGMNTLVY